MTLLSKLLPFGGLPDDLAEYSVKFISFVKFMY
jgi:hypothetical protein